MAVGIICCSIVAIIVVGRGIYFIYRIFDNIFDDIDLAIDDILGDDND